MIGIKNITVQSGFLYQKYLSEQLDQVMQNMDLEHEYRMKDITIAVKEQTNSPLTMSSNPLELYTRSGGELFKEWGLDGYLDKDKIETISKLSLGKDDRTKDYVKIKNHTYQSVKDENDFDVILTKKDITNGYYKTLDGEKIKFEKSDVKTRTGIKRKTDIEFIFTQDATFSYAIAQMEGKDKHDAEQMLISSAIEIHNKVIKQYLHSNNRETGETGFYLYYHNDNRSNQPSSHIHLLVPSLIKLADGSIRAIEIDEIRDKQFHEMIDMQYKSLLVKQWNERFSNYQVEAYDKDLQTITNSTQEIKDWRVAFDAESLQNIRNQSQAKEMIDRAISEQKKDLFNRIELKRNKIGLEALEIENFKEANKIDLPHGNLISHGKDHYQFNKENTQSYFVKVMQPNGKEKVFWGVDLERAMVESTAKTGDLIELDNKHKSMVKVNVQVKDKDGKPIKGKFEEQEVEKATWKVAISDKKLLPKEMMEDVKNKLSRLNKTYENQLRYLDSLKNRSAIWGKIKQKKKGDSILVKSLESAEKVKDMKLTKNEVVGIAFKPKTNEEIIEKLTNTSPFFTRNGLISEIASSSPVGTDAQKLADDLLKRLQENKISVSAGTFTKTQEKFTTWDLIHKEEENVELMRKLFATEQGYKVFNVDAKIDALAKKTGINPNEEQKEFMRTALGSSKGQIVIGLPGSGKTLAAGWTTEIANKEGFRTIGLAPTGKVATSLANETACNITGTIDKFNHDVASGKIKLNANDIIFVDESSMIGTKNFNKLLKATTQANAKLVLIGDPNQIQSVSVGSTLNEFLKDSEIKDRVNYLVEIRRQKDEVALKVAETSSLKEVYKDEVTMRATKEKGSHVIAALEILEKNGDINNKFITTTETISGITKDYLNDKNDFKEKLIITSTNDTINRLNNEIQDRRLEAGEIKGVAYESLKEHFFVGDRIVMEKTSKQYKNGDFGTITAIDKDTKKLTIEFDSKKIVSVSNPSNMRLGYAITYEKSQGMTVNNSYVYGEDSKNNNQELFNVAMTRARFNTKIYTTQSEHSGVVQTWKRESDRVSLVNLGKSLKAEEAKKQALINTTNTIQSPVKLEINNTNKLTNELLKNGLSNIKDNTLLTRLSKFKQVDNKTIKPSIFIKPKFKDVIHAEPPIHVIKRNQGLHINQMPHINNPTITKTPEIVKPKNKMQMVR